MAKRKKPKRKGASRAGKGLSDTQRESASAAEPGAVEGPLWQRCRAWITTFAERKQKELTIACGVLVAVIVVSVVLARKQRIDDQEAWERLTAVNMVGREAFDEHGKMKKDAAEKAIGDLNRVEQELGTTAATPWILLRLGALSYEQGRYDEAVAALERLMSAHEGSYAARLGLSVLGRAYEDKGDLAAAARTFEQSASEREGVLRGLASYDEARCYEALGKETLARKAYEKAVETSPGALWAQMAKHRLSDRR